LKVWLNVITLTLIIVIFKSNKYAGIDKITQGR
jgi:hypothetical protein